MKELFHGSVSEFDRIDLSKGKGYKTNINRVKRIISAYLVEELMKYKQCSRDDAVELMMKTAVYEALMDEGTDLYLESREAVWDLLKEELEGNPYKLLVV